MSKKKIIDAIHQYHSFLITSHINPDGDAIGSELALGYALKQMGKEVLICNQDKVPGDYRFLPGIEAVKLADEVKNHFETLIVLDCGHFDRVEAFTLEDFRLIINIDHHATNNAFGDINWYRPKASSTSELVFELISGLPVEVTPEIATCIYTGLLTDTGCFRYNNTSAKSFKMAAQLVRYGAKPAHIAKAVYENISWARMCLLGESLKTLELYNSGAIACMYVSQDMLRESGAQVADTEDFVNYPRGLKNTKVALFFREIEPDFYKVSLRSKVAIDVALLAEKFGGGGHFNAAGCRVRGELKQVKQQVVNEVSNVLEWICNEGD